MPTDGGPGAKPQPGATAPSLAARAERDAREAAALRRNLRNRKEQQRGRSAPGDEGAGPPEQGPADAAMGRE